MRQVFRKIPVYTGDVSGVCSALFELGGMVVMHDPSGCNSTYNTHDEIRWYDHDSLIFISGLNDTDAILGSDEKLIRDVTEAANIYSPAFIAIANSPIPYITGMDFDAITHLIEKETGIPTFYIMTNGMHDYTRGAGLAFLQIAKRFVIDPKKSGQQTSEKRGTDKNGQEVSDADRFEGGAPGTCDLDTDMSNPRIRVNILGLTPLDFTASASAESLRDKLARAGVEIVSCWAMEDEGTAGDCTRDSSDSPENERKSGTGRGTPFAEEENDREENDREGRGTLRRSLLDDITRSASADVNMVISSTGLPAAEYMKKEFGIPYVAGIPTHGTEKIYFDALRRAAQTGENQFPFRERAALQINEIGRSDSTFAKSAFKPAAGTDTAKNIAEPAAADTAEDIAEPAAGSTAPIQGESPICLIGEPVVMTSIAASLQLLTRAATHVFGMTEEGNTRTGAGNLFLGSEDAAPRGEEELQHLLQRLESESDASYCGSIRVIADPCYEDILPEGVTLIRLPHLAFSGRIFLREIPDIVGESLSALL